MGYSTKDLSIILGVTDRSVRRYIKTFISFENNRISVSEKMLEILKKEYLSGQLSDNPENEYDVVEGFSAEEYQEFQKRLIEYPGLKKELEYHRESARSHQRQMELILRNLEQRNFIEAKDKKLNNES